MIPTTLSAARGSLRAVALPLLLMAGPAPVPADAPRATQDPFEGKIVPLLRKSCLECHDAASEKGEFNLEPLLTLGAAEKDPDRWERVSGLLSMDLMPPRNKPQRPTREEREAIMAWVDTLVQKWDDGDMGANPGRPAIRRLNRNEYNYTIRDLFGLKIRPADRFPADSAGEEGFDNAGDALFLSPLLMENLAEAAGVVAQKVYSDAQARAVYLFARPDDAKTAEQAAGEVLSRRATLAYRRPVAPDELARLVSVFKRESAAKKSYDEALRMPLVAILMSPSFLYRAEEERNVKGSYLVSEYSLASRLSYFLWSSMPDAELIDLAKNGQLSDAETLRAQVRRMLASPKAKALSMHFAGQWLGWDKLLTTAQPDKKRYPEYTAALRDALHAESSEFFHHLVTINGSAYDLLDCDYAFLNEELARHYGIAGVQGREFRKVKLADPNRGGVLGMGSVLTATSMPLRTSPAIRGNYVLTDILGTPPPDPPMDVAQLPEDDREVKASTFRGALEQHRKQESCRACHEHIDPLGFGLENFDALGRWRTAQNGLPVDSNGVLPDGRKFSSPAELKKILLAEKETFARNMVRKLLSYALGRELIPYDRQVVSAIAAKVIADNGRLQTAILEVVESFPFRYRTNDVADVIPPKKEPAAPGTAPKKPKKKSP